MSSPQERVSYEEAVALKEQGWPQVGKYAWLLGKSRDGKNVGYYLSEIQLRTLSPDDCIAPSAVEVLEALPIAIDGNDIAHSLQINRYLHAWTIGYVGYRERFLGDLELEAKTLADAASRMWRHLKSNGIIK